MGGFEPIRRAKKPRLRDTPYEASLIFTSRRCDGDFSSLPRLARKVGIHGITSAQPPPLSPSLPLYHLLAAGRLPSSQQKVPPLSLSKAEACVTRLHILRAGSLRQLKMKMIVYFTYCHGALRFQISDLLLTR